MSKINEYRKTLSKEEFLRFYKDETDKKYQKAKAKYLISKGFYVFEECDKNTEGSLYDHDNDKFYLKVPIDINEEEFFELREKIDLVNCMKATDKTRMQNKVEMQWPTLLGMLILCGGIILAFMNPLLGIVYLGSSIVAMTILFALGSILRVVKEIYYKDW